MLACSRLFRGRTHPDAAVLRAKKEADMAHKEWHDLPIGLGALKLIAMRNELRAKNLHDTEEPPLAEARGPIPDEARAGRTVDGAFNDLKCPMMGATGRRLGRNVPLSETVPDEANMLVPNPRVVSRELLTRTTFQPATIINVLAASWIQFQVHDWFAHAKGSPALTHDVPIDAGDSWPERPMRVPKTPVDPPTRAGSTRPPAYANESSHWWDGSQVYGSTPATQTAVRTGVDGKVRVGADGRLPVDPATGLEVTGFTENGWVGLSLLHALFAREHNAICDRLKADNPGWDDARLFRQARLVTSALMAKIHTVEWTPAILPHPLTQLALRTNWSGVLPALQRVFVGLDDSDLLSGIPGSPTEHHGVPFSLTEEFVAVYRMHPLMPDEFTVCSAANGRALEQLELPAMSGRAGLEVLGRFDLADLWYSMGTAHPGALRLHNFPKHLQHLVRDDGQTLDLATIDILRDRERGVPRYNRFRRLFHKRPVTSFEELTDNPQWAAELKRVYGGDLEKVDLLVGLMAEPLPEGFGFSDTAFRVFILMASRRLKSDRFLSKDYRPEVYTPAGIAWVEETSMVDVLRRHLPALAPALAGVSNAFRPWRKVG
jgi:Animal haem peroxidase